MELICNQTLKGKTALSEQIVITEAMVLVIHAALEVHPTFGVVLVADHLGVDAGQIEVGRGCLQRPVRITSVSAGLRSRVCTIGSTGINSRSTVGLISSRITVL